jgi:hypothetical protein
MSPHKSLLVLTVLPFALSGCAAFGLDSTTGTPGSTTGTPGPVSGAGWLVNEDGAATPSPTPSRPGYPAATATPTSSVNSASAGCGITQRIGDVLIPVAVTPGSGSLTVTWPRQGGSNYRVVAIPQNLVSGNQPAEAWQSVAPATDCAVSTTIRGLTSGTPYVVWLDAPNTGHEVDGTRHLYSGRSGVVFPN